MAAALGIQGNAGNTAFKVHRPLGILYKTRLLNRWHRTRRSLWRYAMPTSWQPKVLLCFLEWRIYNNLSLAVADAIRTVSSNVLESIIPTDGEL
jgi:hypothetical protein